MRPTTVDHKLAWRQQIDVIRRLLPYLWPRDRKDLRLRVMAAVVLLILAKVANVYVPIVLKYATDALSPNAENVLVAVPLGLLLAYGAVRMAARGFGEIRDAVFARVAQHAIRQVGLQVFRHLHRLSLRFHLDRRTGGLSRAIERGTKGIEFLLTFVLFNIAPTIIEILFVCGILWWMFDWRFAAVTIVSIAGYVALTFRLTEWRIRFRREMNTADSDANTRAIDSLLNFETVKSFNNEAHEARRYDKGLRIYEDAATKSRVSLSALNGAQGVVLAIGITAIMTLAAFGVAAGNMTVGDFVMVNAYLIQLSVPLNLLGTVYREIKQSLVDMEAMFDLLDQPPEVMDKPDARPLEISDGHVEFDNVDFGYDPRRPILHGIEFAVPAGRRVAVVGPSGAGKSTISRLLFRFYDVTGGAIRIDGQDIREVTQDSLRAAIGIVPQDTVLFNDTIFYNIAYGRPGASAEEVHEAARLARIHDFIMALPDGYDSVVGERGLKLSGGEKQRVAIARAILKQPRIMLFDEATSALDTKTEREIQTSLAEVARGRTTLVVAHRLSTVVDADEILVLEQGRIVERGRHADLIRAGGAYAVMWARQQAGGDENEAAEAEVRAAETRRRA
ncbi:ABCB family ABC transporter ATP-binding protein/permease [Ferruginivarius sediminum]|uniref:ABC transporter ATP-binding protein/permease n=1 Tax=Ferruginivarius sediminum TaxID=2661937 RepID=A0A369TB95_9PROT|nr:ABC transporter ATP-binding protein/permease [Ferruginivarius sediminum]RDD60206.1 ABC transporter ATP-binding protein/permease [Ferruginivarius sediminum]